MGNRVYILKICYNPNTEEVEWLTEDLHAEDVYEEFYEDDEGDELLLYDPFDVLDEDDLTQDEIRILNSSEIGFA